MSKAAEYRLIVSFGVAANFIGMVCGSIYYQQTERFMSAGATGVVSLLMHVIAFSLHVVLFMTLRDVHFVEE